MLHTSIKKVYKKKKQTLILTSKKTKTNWEKIGTDMINCEEKSEYLNRTTKVMNGKKKIKMTNKYNKV